MIEDDNRFLQLSEEGKRLASRVERNDELLETLFREVFGVNSEQAKIDACKVEHLLSSETTVKLATFIQFIESKESIVKEFLTGLQKQQSTCTHNTENCTICDKVCFLT